MRGHAFFDPVCRGPGGFGGQLFSPRFIPFELAMASGGLPSMISSTISGGSPPAVTGGALSGGSMRWAFIIVAVIAVILLIASAAEYSKVDDDTTTKAEKEDDNIGTGLLVPGLLLAGGAAFLGYRAGGDP
jgi:hypothetical protein